MPRIRRTAQYGLFRTRTPELMIVTSNLPPGSLKVSLDDGEEDTDDELDITKLAKLSGDVNAISGIARGFLWAVLCPVSPIKRKVRAGYIRSHSKLVCPTRLNPAYDLDAGRRLAVEHESPT